MRHQSSNISPATLCLAAAIALVAATILFNIFVPKYAHSAENERETCTIAAKAKKNLPSGPTTTKKTPKPSLPAITITYEGPRKPVSFDASGTATYHEGMIPVMKAVVLPDLADVGLVTRRRGGLVESHVRMRIAAFTDTRR